ncbi:Lrp/AsnC family transcriptional regulator [Candidatus Micrarchaeota archaeon]|nr:Lrp/AsnC family transcriptional regulator [Candidatus Micrarchaeota archaeon]
MEKIPTNEEDMLLLEILQKDCKKSLKEIAKEVGIPMSTVHEKIKRFENMRLIKNYRAVLDEKKLGFGVTAFIMACTEYIKGERTFQRNIGEKVASLPYVLETHTLSGEWDLLIKVKCENVHQLGKFVNERIRTIQGISKTVTMVSIDEIKEETALKLI